ncbi:MAG: helicase-related protein, partial [Myxococcota bacterium]
GDRRWPLRLVFTLPMRVLVEQVERTLRGWVDRLRELAGADHGADSVAIHVLMGGVRTESWHLFPERPAILIGTQDMILSRALCRGFGAARGRWPMDFALLNHDALWVLDEIQLMDVGLTTSVQLAAFRDADSPRTRRAVADRPCHCWWMSATLQTDWLGHGAEAGALVAGLGERMVTVPETARSGAPWDIAKRASRRSDIDSAEQVAELAAREHTPGTLSLVIVNRVDRAVAVFAALDGLLSEGSGKKRRRRDDAPDVRLIHSRFRGAERAAWADAGAEPDVGGFLRGDADVSGAGRILVATQVVEAGVDISARLLISDLAPWASLVQRAGRAGRRERDRGARIIVVRARMVAG